MNSNIKEILNTIDNYLAQDNEDSRLLWDILTALRGPDNAAYGDKDTQTIPIRRAAFPVTASLRNTYPNGAYFGSEKDNKVIEYPFLSSASSHFQNHISYAVLALNFLK